MGSTSLRAVPSRPNDATGASTAGRIPERVLIVDDTGTDRHVLARLLRKDLSPALEILEARDGEEAIALLDGIERAGGPLPELILLDIDMPRMNGHEFLQTWFADACRDVSVVAMLSSSSNAEDRRVADSHACVRNYLVKPIDRGQLQRLPEMLGPHPRALDGR